MLRSLTDVVRAIREGTQPLVTLEEGARTCYAAFAITQAYRGDRAIDVAPFEFTAQPSGARISNGAGDRQMHDAVLR